MRLMLLILFVVGCGKGEGTSVSSPHMHSITDASIEILIDNDPADPEYSVVAFIFQMNEGEEPLDVWEMNRTAPGTLEYSWELNFSIGNRSFEVGFENKSSPEEEPKIGTLIDLIVAEDGYLNEFNRDGEIIFESPEGSVGTGFSSETNPYRILLLIIKSHPLFSTLSAGNITNVTLKSSGYYMQEIQTDIPGTFGP